MIPPVIRPSSLPALAQCPCYSPDQETGQEQKSDGTKRHTALGLYLADEPNWADQLGGWDADGVQWAGEYIRAHAPLSMHPLEIEQRRVAMLPDLTEIPGTPDVVCGADLFDLKGRDCDSYREQMDAYVLMTQHPIVHVHVLYATERRADEFEVHRHEAEARTLAIVNAATDQNRRPRVCDWCGWCVNRPKCPAFAEVGETAARHLGLTIPPGAIEDVRDSAGLGELKRAADAAAEWAKIANAHVREMAVKQGVVADGFTVCSRKGNPSITDAWAAVQASGLPIEAVATSFSISLPDLSAAYATHHGLKEKAARADLETRLGSLIERGSTVHYLKATR